jgi:hypothetical protein
MKRYVVSFLLGFIVGVLTIISVGCGGEDVYTPEPDGSMVDVFVPDTTPPEPDLMLTQNDPVQACYDLVQWLTNKALECSGSQEAANKFKKALEDGLDCPSVTGIRDAVELYTACQPAIKSLSCTDFETANSPTSCNGQLM